MIKENLRFLKLSQDISAEEYVLAMVEHCDGTFTRSDAVRLMRQFETENGGEDPGNQRSEERISTLINAGEMVVRERFLGSRRGYVPLLSRTNPQTVYSDQDYQFFRN